jgi:hypothetical protein
MPSQIYIFQRKLLEEKINGVFYAVRAEML